MARPSFPKTLREFRERFAGEDECYEYLIQSRWPEGITCPRCRGRQFWRRRRRWVHQCGTCGFEVSPTAGTLLQDSHMPIREWFWTAYLVATHTPGLSAKQLQRQLGCSYKTAWYMLHRLRRAMVNEGRSPLQGVVEADETIVGGPVEGLTGRGVTAAESKTLVLGAVEVLRWQDKDGCWQERAGRLRLTPVVRANEESIGRFLRTHVVAGTTIRTDGWRGYSQSALSVYRHEAVPGQRARHIHRAFGNLKTWLVGTHHGVDPKYLSHYLDEYVFRFNRRNTPMAAFQTLLGLTGARKPIGYRALTAPVSTG
jgi:hypothetical protein